MKDIDTDYDCDSNSFYLEETNPKKPKGDGEAVVFDQGLFRSFKPDNSLTTNSEAKECKRLSLNAAIQGYVAAGGGIKKCKPGKYRKYGPSGPRPPAGSVARSPSLSPTSMDVAGDTSDVQSRRPRLPYENGPQRAWRGR